MPHTTQPRVRASAARARHLAPFRGTPEPFPASLTAAAGKPMLGVYHLGARRGPGPSGPRRARQPTHSHLPRGIAAPRPPRSAPIAHLLTHPSWTQARPLRSQPTRPSRHPGGARSPLSSRLPRAPVPAAKPLRVVLPPARRARTENAPAVALSRFGAVSAPAE